jgi:hypothetical protein
MRECAAIGEVTGDNWCSVRVGSGAVNGCANFEIVAQFLRQRSVRRTSENVVSASCSSKNNWTKEEIRTQALGEDSMFRKWTVSLVLLSAFGVAAAAADKQRARSK